MKAFSTTGYSGEYNKPEPTNMMKVPNPPNTRYNKMAIVEKRITYLANWLKDKES
jgi:hypothetical protein